MSSNQIIVAAVSARPFVKAAAQAGYEVIAMDVFADADTQRAAKQTFKITYANGGFVADELERNLSQLNLNEVIGFVYGSGFEAQPDLLDRIEARLTLLGNRPAVVRDLKRPAQFFGLLDTLDIPHPAITFQALENAQGLVIQACGRFWGYACSERPLLAMHHPRGITTNKPSRASLSQCCFWPMPTMWM